jgi:hypothetical protein
MREARYEGGGQAAGGRWRRGRRDMTEAGYEGSAGQLPDS